ncbi:hypothetical protein TNCV_3463821 [Trichonephila clavipes]|nr:hypothetical protein TNCV_3463821 [Trichonephila clavipes]
MSFTPITGSGRPRQTSHREDCHIVRNARVQPSASSTAIQAQVAPSLGVTFTLCLLLLLMPHDQQRPDRVPRNSSWQKAKGRTLWDDQRPPTFLPLPPTSLAARRLFRVPPCCAGTIHLQTCMSSPGFEPSPYGTAVSAANHYTGWVTPLCLL